MDKKIPVVPSVPRVPVAPNVPTVPNFSMIPPQIPTMRVLRSSNNFTTYIPIRINNSEVLTNISSNGLKKESITIYKNANEFIYLYKDILSNNANSKTNCQTKTLVLISSPSFLLTQAIPIQNLSKVYPELIIILIIGKELVDGISMVFNSIECKIDYCDYLFEKNNVSFTNLYYSCDDNTSFQKYFKIKHFGAYIFDENKEILFNTDNINWREQIQIYLD